MNNQIVTIAGREIGPAHPPYLIADLSANHLGSLTKALQLMDAAKDAGCEAIKPQLYRPEEMCKPGTIAQEGPWAGLDLYYLYERIQTPRKWFPVLFEHGRDIGLTVFSSVFSLEGVDFLESLGCPAYKIAANEYNWKELIDKCIATGKPVLVSEPNFDNPYPGTIPLFNFPGYPCVYKVSNMGELKNGKGVYGFSSHIMEIEGMAVAVALGASIVEYHLTLYREDGGPDVSFSWEPPEAERISRVCRLTWEAMKPQETKLPGYRRNVKTGLREVA